MTLADLGSADRNPPSDALVPGPTFGWISANGETDGHRVGKGRPGCLG
jgi:hypothetical protein